MDEAKALELYKFFEEEGYDVGGEVDFLKALEDDFKRKELYNFFTEQEGYDLGKIDDFILKKKDDSLPTGEEEVMVSDTQVQMEEPGSSEPSAPETDEVAVKETETLETPEPVVQELEDPFENSMQVINLDLMTKNEEAVVPKLRYHFEDYGFQFEQTGLGDRVKVIAPNGEEIVVETDNITDKKDIREGEKIKEFLRNNRIDPNQEFDLENRYKQNERKFFNQEEVDIELANMNELAKIQAQQIKQYIANKAEFDLLNQQYESMSQEEIDANPDFMKLWNEQKAALEQQLAQLKYQDNTLKLQGAELDRAVGSYYTMKAQTGTKMGAFYNALLQAYSNMGSGLADLVIDVSTYLAPLKAQMGEEAYNEALIEKAIEKGFIQGDKENLIKNVERYTELLEGDQLDEINSEILDDNRKILKYGKGDEFIEQPYSKYAGAFDEDMGILQAIREGLPTVAGDDETTREYSDLTKQSFWGGALLGLTESLPAMVGGAGGWAQRTAQMYTQISDALTKEMENDPAFADVTEAEKAALKLPLGVVVTTLEAYGLRNVMAQKGLANKILLRVLQKKGTDVAGRSFQEVVNREVKSMIAKGVLTVTAAGLAEFETGAAQELADIGAKELFNYIKEDEYFKTPENILSEIIYAGAQEAVGGFILGVPNAIVNAASTYDFTKLDDGVFELFEDISKDDSYKDAYVQTIKQAILDGDITKEEGQAQLNTYNEVVNVMNQIPVDFSTEQKEKALGILLRTQKLEQEIEGKDPRLVKKQKQEIEDLNQQLDNILYQEPDASTEQSTVEETVPVESETTEEVVEGVPDQVQRPAREGDTQTEGDQPTQAETQVAEETKDLQLMVEGEVTEDTDTPTDQEGQVFEQVDEVVSINRASKPPTRTNQFKNFVQKKASRAGKALARIAPDVNIVLHENAEDYFNVTNSKGKGTFIDNTIHINLESADRTTVAHESFHAILLSKLKTDAAAGRVTKNMMTAISKSLSKDSELKKNIDAFASNYDENIQNEEKLAQIIGEIAAGYKELDAGSKSTLRRWIDRIAKGLGIKVEEFTQTEQDVVNLLNTIAKKVTTGQEIEEGDVSIIDDFAGGKQVDKPIDALKRQQIGGFEISYTQQENIENFLKEGKITQPENLDFLEGNTTTITSPDDMLAGEIKYDGKVIFEGEGGVFFVTKFGDVWASGKAGTANTIANALNTQIKENGGKAYLTLTKGTDKKLISSASGVKSTLAILDVMLDNNLISPSLFRSAVSTAVRKAGGNINLRQSAKELKKDVNDYFTDPTTTTFEKRGFIIEDIAGELAKNLPKEGRAAIIEFLDGDPNKTLAKKTSRTANGLVDLLARITAEKLTKGLSVGDVYAVIEVNGEVEVKKDNHPSYPFHIALKDGGAPILHLPKDRQSGSDILIQKSGKKYAVRNVSVVEGRYEKQQQPEVQTREQKDVKFTIQKKRIYKETPKALTILTSGYGGKFINLPMSQITISEAPPKRGYYGQDIGQSGEMVRITMPRWLFSRNTELEETGGFELETETKKREQKDVFKKDMSATEIIIAGRDNNFSDASIKEYLTKIRKLKVKEVNELMAIKADLFSKMPPSFGDVKGGAKVGAKLYSKILKLRAKLEKDKTLTKNEVMDRLIEFLQAQPEYIAEGQKGGLTVQQAKMETELQRETGIRPTKNIGANLRAARQLIRNAKRTTKNLQTIKRELRNFIRKSLPKDSYTKSEVINMVRKITDADATNIDRLMGEVETFVMKRAIRDLDSKISKILDLKQYTKKSGKRKAAKTVDVTVLERLTYISDFYADIKNAETADSLGKLYESLLSEFNKLAKKPEPTDSEIQKMVDLEILMSLTNAEVMRDQINANRIDALDKAASNLGDLVAIGKTNLKEQINEARQKYLDDFATAYQAIRNDKEKLDMNDPETKDMLRDQEILDAQDPDVKGVKSRLKKWYGGLSRLLARPFNSLMDLSTLMNHIDAMPGDLFGGELQTLVTDRIDASTREFKGRIMLVEKAVTLKLQDIFGKKWKFLVPKLRKPEPTGIFIENRAGRRELILSQNQMYYYYNQYKDPANAAKFQKTFGDNYVEIMDQITEKIDPKVKEFADWQVNEFFPSLYNHYNEVYKRIYRTNMPWNQFYAGMLYTQGQKTDAGVLNLLGEGNPYQTSVGAGSTIARQDNKNAIIDMDGTDALFTYLRNMEYFAAYAESVRDINKIFTNDIIRGNIKRLYGKDIMGKIDTIIQRVASKGIMSQQSAVFINWMNNAFILSRLGLSPLIHVKQMTSVFTYANDIGPLNWLKYGAGLANIPKLVRTWREMGNNSVYMQDRKYESIVKVLESYSDTAMQEFIPTPVKDKIVNMMMFFIKTGDRNAIMLGGMPNYLYYKDQALKAGKSEQEAIDEAIIKFERDTKRTQQSSDIQDRDVLQTGDPLYRALNMFLTTPKQYMRKEIQAFTNLNRKLMAWDRSVGKGSGSIFGDNMRTLAMYHVFMPVLFQWVTNGMPGLLAEWEDEDEADLLRAAIIGNLNALFIIGDVFNIIGDAATGKPWAGNPTRNMPIVTVAANLAKQYEKINRLKDPEKKAEATKKFVYELLTLGYIPSGNIDKMAKNFMKIVEGGESPEKAIMRLLNYSEYQIEGKQKKKKKPKRTIKLNKKEMKMYDPEAYYEMMDAQKDYERENADYLYQQKMDKKERERERREYLDDLYLD